MIENFTELFELYYKDINFTIHDSSHKLIKRFVDVYVISNSRKENKEIVMFYNDDINDVIYDYNYDNSQPFILTRRDKNYYTILAAYTLLTYSTITEDFDKFYFKKINN